MFDSYPISPVVARLNERPLSRHVSTVMKRAQVCNPPYQLTLLNLLAWASKHHYSSQLLAEMELGAMVSAAERDPDAVYDNLADDRMLDDQTMPDLAATLVSRMSDLLDDRSLPNWLGQR